MKYLSKRGQTGNIAFVFLGDSSSTTGGGKTTLTHSSSGLTIAVRRELSAAFTSYSGANIGDITTLGTWVDPGAGKCNFKECDSANAPGLYEIHFRDAVYDASDASRKLVGMVMADGVVPTPFEIALSAFDIQDAVRGALTSLPNAAANAAGGLPVSAAGSLDMDDMAADIDAVETRVILAIPSAAPNAAGGLLITTAGSLDMDDLAADVDAAETRVTTALPNAAPGAAGGLPVSAAGSLSLDDIGADLDELITTIGVAGAGLSAIPGIGGGSAATQTIFIDSTAASKSTLSIQQGNSSIVIVERLLLPNGYPMDLTGKTVHFTLVPQAGGAAVVDQAATILWAAGGYVSYTLSTADTATVGQYYRRWNAQDGSGHVITYPSADNLAVIIHA